MGLFDFLKPKPPEPKTPEQIEKEKIAVALMIQGATFDSIKAATGFSDAELDRVMRENGRAFVVWMWVRNVDTDTMLRKSPYSGRASLDIMKEYEACRKEGRTFKP